MRIAVIADTHDRLPQRLYEQISAADEIWHLGDVCDPDIIDEWRALGHRVTVVRGNCDDCIDWPWTAALCREDHIFHLIHIPPDKAPPGCHAVLHGHTHVPRDQIVSGVRFLNPGCVTRPNRGAPPSFGWLEVTAGQPFRWSLAPL